LETNLRSKRGLWNKGVNQCKMSELAERRVKKRI
jgi:hypothetical protein